MVKTLEQFKNNTLGGSFGNPGTNTYVGQCVSYVRQYMEQVLGVPSKAIGNAVDYYNSPYMAQYFDKVSDRQDGDIICYGDDPGSWTGFAGHIAIWYRGQLLNQNYGGSLKVSVNPFFQPGYQGALRLKGDNMQEQINELNKQLTVTNKYIEGLQADNREFMAQLDNTNKHFDAMVKRVSVLEQDQGSTGTLDGTYNLTKVA